MQRIAKESLKDLQKSIKANGFLPIERIVVSKIDGTDRYLVIEGNRRVAALKNLREQSEASIEIPERVIDTFSAVPCVVVEDDGEFPFFKQTLMGIRHVGGIKEWGGYQRAKLIADLIDDHNIDSSEVSDRLGLSVQEVNRRYRAFSALKQMEEDEDYAEYVTPAMYPIFHEAISLPVVRNWLGWSNDSCSFNDETTLYQFYDLITPTPGEGGAKDKDPKLKTYSDVRELKRILPNTDAKTYLLDEGRSFLDALTVARKDELSRKWRTEVNEAASALEKIGALQVKNLTSDDIESITKLRDMAAQVLDIHETVSKR